MKKILFLLVSVLTNCGGPDYSSYTPQYEVKFEPTTLVAELHLESTVSWSHVDFEPIHVVVVLPERTTKRIKN